MTQSRRRFLFIPFLSSNPGHVGQAAIAAILALFVCAATAAEPAISARNARIRLLPADLPLAGYFELVNQGKQPLTLVGASSPAFRTIHMHLSTAQNGKSTMLMIEGIEMNPGETLHFTPGGYHLMLMQRVKPLQVDDQVPITLKFSGNQSLEVMFKVEGAGSQ
ncbi:MAG TPA: copper chaperone PCu(A)C [Candidatus Methylomirabilis sp.]|nr:copper chaperone PCu(A)C [Candidatus Methylomirabilis sp.]